MSIHRSEKTTDISSPDSFLHPQLPNSTTQLQSSTRNATNIELPLPPRPTQLQPADLHALYDEISKITARHFGASSHVSLLVKDLGNITSFIECFPNTPSGFDGCIYERQRNAEAEIANSPLLLGNGLRPAIIALQMTGTFTPYQRDYVRYLHARFPQLLKAVNLHNQSITVFGGSSDDCKIGALQSEVSNLLTKLSKVHVVTTSDPTELIAKEGYFSSEVASAIKTINRHADSNESNSRGATLSQLKRKDLIWTESAIIDSELGFLHLSQVGNERSDKNRAKLERQIASNLPELKNVSVLRNGRLVDIDLFLRETFEPHVNGMNLYQDEETIHLGLLCTSVQISKVQQLIKEKVREFLLSSPLKLKAWSVLDKCPDTAEFFRLTPPEAHFCGLVRSKDNQSAIICLGDPSKFPVELRAKVSELFAFKTFLAGEQFETLSTHSSEYKLVTETIPTAIDLRSISRCGVTGDLELKIHAPLQFRKYSQLSKATVEKLELDLGCRVTIQIIEGVNPPTSVKKALDLIYKYAGPIEKKLNGESRATAFRGIGGCQTIGGSCLLLDLGELRFLLDCGKSFDTSSADAISPEIVKEVTNAIGTHLHADHIAKWAAAVRAGLTAPIFLSRLAAIGLYPVLLEQMKHESGAHLSSIEELYRLIRPLPFGVPVSLSNRVDIILHSAGHSAGACAAELLLAGGERVLYTGDYKTTDSLVHRAATLPNGKFDIVIAEGTYGIEDIPAVELVEAELIQSIKNSVEAGGTVVMPSLALGRTQEVLSVLSKMQPWLQSMNCPVEVFGGARERSELYSFLANYDSRTFVGGNGKQFAWEQFINERGTRPNSGGLLKHVKRDKKSRIIVIAGGMMAGGAVDVTKLFAHDPKNLLVLSCYQSEGTLGRKILDFAAGTLSKEDLDFIKETRAPALDFDNFHMKVLHSRFSGHVSGPANVETIRTLTAPGGTVVLVHGEMNNLCAIKKKLLESGEIGRVVIPANGELVTF